MDRFHGAVVASILIAGVAAAQPGAAQTYEIDAERSDVHWQIYRAGAVGRLGHNHVISVGEMNGTVHLGEGDEAARFEIEVPVDALVVDDPELRARKGEDFESEPSEGDVAGTRSNMLSEDVLDAEQYPALRVSGTLASGALDAEALAPGGAGQAQLDLSVEIRGMTRALSAPASITLTGDTLTAEGMRALTHEELGLEPFSVMLGALRVAEEIDLFYRVVATRADGVP